MRKYFSVDKPIKPESIPESRRIGNVVNFGVEMFCPEIEKTAWGYIEYNGILRNFKDYNLVEELPKFKRRLEPGDAINSHGIQAVIKKILSQDFYEDEYTIDSSYIDCEFLDIEDKYRRWRSNLDRGSVVYYDKGNIWDSIDDSVRVGLKCLIDECMNYLKHFGVDFRYSLVYFKMNYGDYSKCYLFESYKSLGYIDLEDNTPDEHIFRRMLGMIMNLLGSPSFIAFPCALNNWQYLILKEPPALYLKYIRQIALDDLRSKISYPEEVSYSLKSKVLKTWVQNKGVLSAVVDSLNENINPEDGIWEGIYSERKRCSYLRCLKRNLLIQIPD